MLASGDVRADVKLKIAVMNPSSTEKQTSPVRYDLPKGIGPDQVLDVGDLEMKYDFDKGNYYLTGSCELAPEERKVLEVTLRDVWSIPETQINLLKAHEAELMSKLKGTKHFQAGEALSKNISVELKNILKKEQVSGTTVKDRINRYYEDLVVLNQVRERLGMLENLVLDVGGIVEERVQVPATLAVPIASSQEEASPGNVIDLNVKVSNPSKEKMNTSAKFLLPAEVSPRFILDRNGFDMAYDFEKECFYLYKEDVDLGPSETKEFIVKIRDMWKIEPVELGALKAHTRNILVLLEGSEHYKKAKILGDKIMANMDFILRSQNAKVSAMQHIAYYRDNMKLLAAGKKEVAELEKLVSQRGTSAGVTVKWPDEAGGGEGLQRKRGYEGIDLIARSIFKGKAPTVATTWKIIFIIIAFIGTMAALLFALWYTQLKKKKGSSSV